MITQNIERRLQRVEDRLKRIEKELELSGTFLSLDWEEFNPKDKTILAHLLKKKNKGATTTEIANTIGLDSPESSGRTIVYTRLKRIERISRRLKGMPIVVTEKKRWYMNFDEYSFPEGTLNEKKVEE